MQKPYQNLTLIIGLLLAPIPILTIYFLHPIFTNSAFFDNYEGHSNLLYALKLLLFVYLFYVFIPGTVLFALLYWLNKYQKIHFFILFCIAYFSAIFIDFTGQYFYKNRLPDSMMDLKNLFLFNDFFIFTGSTAFVFWLYLKWHDYINRSKIKA